MNRAPFFVLSCAALLLHSTHASAQSLSLAPTFSFGYGWLDGQYDHIGDDRSLFRAPCADQPLAPNCFLPRESVAAAGTVGVLLERTWSRRFAVTAGLDLVIGATHRIGEYSNTYTMREVRREHSDNYAYEPTIDLSPRVASTVRSYVGVTRRGYLGVGLRAGYRRQVGHPNGEVFRRYVLSAEGEFVELESELTRPYPHGLTLEALLEGGVVLGHARRATLGLLLGGGRPRFRADVVLSFPITLGGR